MDDARRSAKEEPMVAGRCKRVREHAQAVRRWPLWQLQPWLVTFIAVITALYLAAIGLALTVAPVTGTLRDLALFAALLICTAGTVELTKRAGENAGLIKDVFTVWELPIAILLPPVYLLVVPIFRLTLTQLRIRRGPLHRRVFTTAVIGLSLGSASIVFHVITGQGLGAGVNLHAGAAVWLVAVAAAAAVHWAVNNSLVFAAIKGSEPAATIRKFWLARETVV